MNRDRGTIKWNAMMLPEHVKLLRQWKNEDNYTALPMIDEWALQEIAEQLKIAAQTAAYIELTYWQAGKVMKERGNIEQLQQHGVLFQQRHIPFHHLLRLTILAVDK